MADKPRRLARLLTFGLLALLAALLAVDVALAWLYVSALTRPGCPQTAFLDDLPQPEQHWLQLDDGRALRAWYYPSENGAAILAMGGLGGALGRNLPPVAPLIRAGYGVLQIDTFACAEPPARVTLGAREVDAAAAGLDFFLTRPDVHPDRIGAIGFSMGGVTLIRAAARQPHIRALVAEGGYDHLGEHITRPGVEKPLPRAVFLHTVAGVYWLQTGVNPWRISPRADIAAISPRPVLLIYGEEEVARGGGWAQYEAAGEPKEIWIVPGGDHGINDRVAPDVYERKVLNFFERYLGDGSNLRENY
jgi:dipeptidyl aminopeptidase/acylaminoacyl peptidase